MQADCQYGFCCSGVKWIYVDDTGVGSPPSNMASCSCVQFRGNVFERVSTQSSPRLNFCLRQYNLLPSSFGEAQSLCPAILLNLSAKPNNILSKTDWDVGFALINLALLIFWLTQMLDWQMDYKVWEGSKPVVYWYTLLLCFLLYIVKSDLEAKVQSWNITHLIFVRD